MLHLKLIPKKYVKENKKFRTALRKNVRWMTRFFSAEHEIRGQLLLLC